MSLIVDAFVMYVTRLAWSVLVHVYKEIDHTQDGLFRQVLQSCDMRPFQRSVVVVAQPPSRAVGETGCSAPRADPGVQDSGVQVSAVKVFYGSQTGTAQVWGTLYCGHGGRTLERPGRWDRKTIDS